MGNISKEHIGYIVAILSVIASGVISWYFYDKSQQYRHPVYSVEPFSSAVFKANDKKEFPFKVVTNDGKPIQKSIYLSTHYFWNKGEKPILQSDILEPLTVTLSAEDGDLEILNADVSKFSRKVVSCSSKKISSNQIELTYKVLETSDGCAIDILYIGDENPNVEVTGTIIGVDSFEIYSKTVDDYFKSLPWYHPYKRYFPGVVVIIPFSIILILYLRSRQLSKFKFWSDALVYILFVCQIYFITEIRFGYSGFLVEAERPNIGAWESTTANKSVQPTAKAAAD